MGIPTEKYKRDFIIITNFEYQFQLTKGRHWFADVIEKFLDSYGSSPPKSLAEVLSKKKRKMSVYRS